jgi:hypothetical protein
MLKTVREDWFVYILVAIALISAAIHYMLLQIFGDHPQLSLEVLRSLIDTGVLSVTVFLFVFSKWLWKLPALQKIGLVKFPDLSGTWEGELITSIDGTKLPLNCTIRQNPWSIAWECWTPHSKNSSITTQLVIDEASDDAVLSIVYRNVADQGNAAQHSVDHHGACLLDLVRKEGELRASTDWKLIGSYWTNKKVNGRSGTTGTFSFCWKKREARRGKPAEQQSANASATA